MCGIAGIVQAGDRPVDCQVLEAMTASLQHRGPDGEGYVLLAPGQREKPFPVIGSLRRAIGSQPGRYPVGLGHQRLAIIDRTALGHQPMGTEDGLLWITYNGEVYNAPELRRELTALGHRFRSSSDTEVVLEGYRRWGTNCLPRLNGMFAFAIWDGRENALFCARDRFGIKPFYYHWDGRRFLFASEMKALFQDPSIRPSPNPFAVFDYLSQSRQDHTTETFFDRILQLAPGSWMSVRPDAKPNQLGAQEQWWRLPEETHPVGPDEAAVRMRDLIEDSVRLELRADVPVGSCLSGGVDSSTIVCLMSRLLPGGRPLTVSSCHVDPRFDERPYILAVLARTGADNREVYPQPVQLFDRLPDILWHQEEPFANTSVLAQWEVMRAAGGAGVKVLLDGQGADELLCGYPGYLGSRLADLLRAGRWVTAGQELRSWRRVHGGLHPTAVGGLVRGLLPAGWAGWLRSRVTGESGWLDRSFARRCDRRDTSQAGNGTRLGSHDFVSHGSVLRAHMARSVTQDLPALLHYEDRNAMAFSVEARVPFLDHRLVEWLATLPPELKLRQGMTKVVLRAGMEGILPEVVRRRPDKMGFVTPEDQWLRGALRPKIEAILASESMRARPYWRASALPGLYQKFCEGKLAIGPAVWRWINLESWLRRFCD